MRNAAMKGRTDFLGAGSTDTFAVPAERARHVRRATDATVDLTRSRAAKRRQTLAHGASRRQPWERDEYPSSPGGAPERRSARDASHAPAGAESISILEPTAGAAG